MKNGLFRNSMKWSVFISVVTFVLACLFTVVSTSVLEGVSWGVGVLVVFLLILNGIVFDMMGLAAAAADETPFHAMASKKVAGARHAIGILRNADRFANFCNDVIGDISGIISGAASALVVIKLMAPFPESSIWNVLVSVVFTGLVSALTVGGKALGKSFSIRYATEIVLCIGKIFYLMERRFRIRILTSTRKQRALGKRGNKHAARTNQPA